MLFIQIEMIGTTLLIKFTMISWDNYRIEVKTMNFWCGVIIWWWSSIKCGQLAVTPQFWQTSPQFWQSGEASEKRPPWHPKKWNFGPKKKVIPRIHLDMDFLQKTGSKMVKFGLYGPTSDLQRPIGGHHPMLYFSSQIAKNVEAAWTVRHLHQ